MLLEIVQWVQGHLTEIMSVVLAAHALAVAIVNLTPTPKDNELVASIYTKIEWLAGIITTKAKQ